MQERIKYDARPQDAVLGDTEVGKSLSNQVGEDGNVFPNQTAVKTLPNPLVHAK